VLLDRGVAEDLKHDLAVHRGIGLPERVGRIVHLFGGSQPLVTVVGTAGAPHRCCCMALQSVRSNSSA